MGESTKAVCALLLIVGTIVGVIAWTGDRPDAATWAFRIGGPTVALLALGLILKLQSRADLAHDYLRDVAGSYFNRDGFCFALAATAVDGIAYMDAYFQNQRDKRCLGRIAMRPARGFWMTRLETVRFRRACPGGATTDCYQRRTNKNLLSAGHVPAEATSQRRVPCSNLQCDTSRCSPRGMPGGERTAPLVAGS